MHVLWGLDVTVIVSQPEATGGPAGKLNAQRYPLSPAFVLPNWLYWPKAGQLRWGGMLVLGACGAGAKNDAANAIIGGFDYGAQLLVFLDRDTPLSWMPREGSPAAYQNDVNGTARQCPGRGDAVFPRGG